MVRYEGLGAYEGKKKGDKEKKMEKERVLVGIEEGNG